MGTLRYQNPLWDPPFYYIECFLRERRNVNRGDDLGRSAQGQPDQNPKAEPDVKLLVPLHMSLELFDIREVHVVIHVSPRIGENKKKGGYL